MKKATTFNHYISKVFLKSWLRPDQNLKKDTLLAFLINSQKYEISGRNVHFAAEDFLYSFKMADGEIDDSFESYLSAGENAWGKLLVNLKEGTLFDDKEHLSLCIFLLVSFALRTQRHFKVVEKMFHQSDPAISKDHIRIATLDLIADTIEWRTNELINRKMLLLETSEDFLFTTEAPYFDLKFSKFKSDAGMCAITPRHLLYITDEISEAPTLLYKNIGREPSKLLTLWNNQIVFETARSWVVSTNTEINKN